MEITKKSGTYRLYTEQFLPVSIESAWNFFSNPINLQKITPSDLNFKIRSFDNLPAYPGQIITYSIGINKLLKMNWVTEITHVQEEKQFVDNQLFGPYKLWHHVHRFEQRDGGIMMIDIVHFKLPFQFISPISYNLFVKKKLMKIFQFREEQLNLLIAKNQLN